MDHHDFAADQARQPDDATVSSEAPLPPEERRDEPATPETTSPPAATVPRHLFTLTIADVARQLNRYGFDRDIRTIQRWCKSEKLRAIIDDSNGDRWLILPASVDELLATLIAERERQERDMSATPAPLPRQGSDGVGDTHSVPRQDPTPQTEMAQPQGRQDDDTETTSPDSAATSRPQDEDVAALTRRVTELEKENTLLQIDLKARERMVDYQQEWFDKTHQDMRTDLQRLGELEAHNRLLQDDNARLRSLLPAPPEGQQSLFKPRTVIEDDDPRGTVDNGEEERRAQGV